MKLHTFTLFTFLLTTLGCSSDDSATVGLSVQAVTATGEGAPGDLAFSDDGQSDFSLQAASLHLRQIELDLPDGSTCSDLKDLGDATCDSDMDKIVIDGPFDVDLVEATSTPSLDDVRIPVGIYKRADFRVENDAADVSFAAIAAFEYAGDSLTLDLQLDFNEDIRIEEADGIEVTADTDLIAAFVVDDWLGGVDIAACLDRGDVAISGDTVVVDDGSSQGDCSGIENTIKDNMKNSGQFDKQ